MTIPAEALAERLVEVRDATLTSLLQEQARALNAGSEIEPEPIRRNHSGSIHRDGPLDLPSRGDLGVTKDGRTTIRRIEGETGPPFTPFEAYWNPDFTAEIHPFAWDHAVLEMRSSQRTPHWTPLRHWFLEWFQSRPTDLSPEIVGAVHRLDGPWHDPDGWRAVVDLGTAPASCVASLIAAVGLSGCSRLKIGE